MALPSIKTFEKDYDLIYEQAGKIFNGYNLCQWEENKDGTFSCIVNRLNSQKSRTQFLETNGCCINVCKQPKEHDDEAIKRKQHSNKKGCLVKSLKCKLHICIYLRESNKPDIKEAVEKIDKLINTFRLKYKILWKSVSFASPKKIWIEFYKMHRKQQEQTPQS